MIWTSLIQVSLVVTKISFSRLGLPFKLHLTCLSITEIERFLLGLDDEDVNAETRTHKEYYFKKSANRKRPGPTERHGEWKADDGKANVSSTALQPKNYLFTDENMDYSDDSDGNNEDG